MTVALDTNLLAYAEGVNDEERRLRAMDVLGRLPPGGAIVPVQVLGELFRLLTGKAKRTAAQARSAILSWRDAFPTQDSDGAALLSAMDLVADHHLSFWDALILAAAAEAGCRLLLSEDMQEGFTWRGVTVVNPVAATRHPLLAQIIGGSGECQIPSNN